MTLVNHGFNGSLDEASFAQMMGIEGADGVDVSAAWAVTQGAGRQVSVAASSGWAAAAGVSSKDDTGAITASLSTPAAGQWYLITRRIDWSAHTCTVQAIAHTTTTTTIPTLPPTTYPTYNQTPGTLYDQPLAWAWVRSTDTTMALFDLRALPARTRLATLEAILVRNVVDLDALVTYDPALTEGRILNVDELNADFQAQDGVWVQITCAVFATTGARDTAYLKASAAFKILGARYRLSTAMAIEYEWAANGGGWQKVGVVRPSATPTITGTGSSVVVNDDGSVTYTVGTGGGTCLIPGVLPAAATYGTDEVEVSVTGTGTAGSVSLRLVAGVTVDSSSNYDTYGGGWLQSGTAAAVSALAQTSWLISNGLTVLAYEMLTRIRHANASVPTRAPGGTIEAVTTVDTAKTVAQMTLDHRASTAFDGLQLLLGAAGVYTVKVRRLA